MITHQTKTTNTTKNQDRLATKQVCDFTTKRGKNTTKILPVLLKTRVNPKSFSLDVPETETTNREQKKKKRKKKKKHKHTKKRKKYILRKKHKTKKKKL